MLTPFFKFFLTKLCLLSPFQLLTLLLFLSNQLETIPSTIFQEEISISLLRPCDSTSTSTSLNKNPSTSKPFLKPLPLHNLHLILPSTSLIWSTLTNLSYSSASCITWSTMSTTCLWDNGSTCNPMQVFGSSQKCMPWLNKKLKISISKKWMIQWQPKCSEHMKSDNMNATTDSWGASIKKMTNEIRDLSLVWG